MKEPTPTIRALQILKANAIMSATQFGHMMWPGSPAWHRYGRSGHGVAKGVGIRRGAGAFLGKLRKKGYISPLYPVRLTKLGEATLGDWEAQ